MKRIIMKKLLCVLLVVLTLFSTCFNLVSSAHTNITSAYLQKIGQADYHLKYDHGDRVSYIICSVVGHHIDGVFYPAYCVNRNLAGAETAPYDVAITQVLDNNAVWRVLVNAYPYKSAASMGLSEFDAFCVTKMAVYCVLGQSDVNKFVADPGDGTAVHMLNKLRELVNIGFNGSETMQRGTLSSGKVGEFTETGNYYYQEYSVNSGVEISNYSITNIAGFGDGSFVANTNGGAQNSFGNGEHFRIYVPKSKLNADINGAVSISARTKTYPILYGESNNPNLQDYVVTSDPYGDESIVVNMKIATNTGKVKVNKTDDYTKNPIQGVTFGLYRKDGTEVAKATTGADGVATFSSLYQNSYVLKELSTNEKYILNTMEFDVDVKFNGTSTVNVENEHKKGNLKVYKVDKDNNKITLGGVEFELYSEEFKKVIGTYKTNQDGEIYVENLRIGNFKLHETLTNKWYNLAEDTEIVVEWNETTDTTVENELKKSQVKIIKVDLDNNEVKLEGVKFNVLDANKNVLETIVTDKNGEAKTKKYAIRDFEKLILQEVETKENYVLNDKPVEIVLEANKIKDIEFQNEKKKGQVKVIKVDKDNNEIKLEGVAFEVYDENNNKVDTLITDKNGEAVSKRLPIDMQYSLKETITGETYVLNEEIKTVTLEQDKITNITFENEKKKGQIEVIKVDAENNEVKLEGVIFEILDKDGNVVDTITTDKEGKAITKRIAIDNEYTVREKESKKEYILSEETVKVTLKEDEIKSITFENTKKRGSIKILKVSNGYSQLLDIADGTPLAGAKFVIVNSKGESVGVYETGEDGTVQIDNVEYGEYTIYEYEVPEGFLMDAEPQTVFISENGQIIDVTFKDSPVQPELPKTGIDNDINFAIIGIFAIALSSITILIKKYRKMEE